MQAFHAKVVMFCGIILSFLSRATCHFFTSSFTASSGPASLMDMTRFDKASHVVGMRCFEAPCLALRPPQKFHDATTPWWSGTHYPFSGFPRRSGVSSTDPLPWAALTVSKQLSIRYMRCMISATAYTI
ncbi:hypothetical protein BDZ89DRAFT_259819 [Hymenopellis radicata]|nr:hypothetical protein BDZ89DRAFT_259819 [Hymenopellis radicata]